MTRQCQESDVYSLTAVANQRSWMVMQRLGMSNTGNNFVHPMIPQNHALSERVLYKITRSDWANISE